MDPLRRDQVSAWIASTRRAVYTVRRADVAPIRAIEVSERLYDLLKEYAFERADYLGEDVYNATGSMLFMHIPVIVDPNLPFEFEPLHDQPTIVAFKRAPVKRAPVKWVGRLSPDPAPADPAAQSGDEGLSVSFLAGKGRL